MSPDRARRWLARAALLVACLASPGLRAEVRHRVVVVDARDMDDATTLELLARVRGELGAAGFDVFVLPVTGEVDPRVAAETLARELEPAAVLSVRHSRGAALGESVAEMWVSDRLSNRTLMQRATFHDSETSAQTARLAVQVAELLKARLALLWVEPGTSSWTPVPARVEATAPVAPAPPTPPESEANRADNLVLLGAGVGLLHNFEGGFGSTWAPVLRLGVAPSALSSAIFALEFRASGALTPDASELGWGPGVARVRQGFSLVEVLGRFVPESSVQPVLSLGSGVFAVSAAGEAERPYFAQARTTWSALSALGAGFCIQPSASVAWILEGQVLATWSKTSVAIADRTIGSVGWPMAFFSTSVVGIY